MSPVRVGSYTVEVYGLPNQRRNPNRNLSLLPHESYDGVIRVVGISFIPRSSQWALDVRTAPIGDGKLVYAYLPEDDFDPMYHVLQTEEPVYFDWAEGLYFRLITSEEPVGEGYADVSSPDF